MRNDREDLPFFLGNRTCWLIGVWFFHILSWVAVSIALYWVRNILHPVVLVALIIWFLYEEYYLIFKVGRKK